MDAMKQWRRRRGVTLIEMLVTTGIIVVMAGLLVVSLNETEVGQRLGNDTKTMVGFVRDVQQRAITQEEGARWGLHLVDATNDSYELFYGDDYMSGTIVSERPLSGSVEFDSYTSADIVFEKITGAPISGIHTITLRLKGGACPTECKIITINENGTITND